MKRLKELRNAIPLTQQEVADKLGLDRVSYARYENGTRIPTIETLEKLSDYFGVTTDYLLGRTDIPNIYAHEGIRFPDGREGVLLTTQKNLPARERKQVEDEVLRAIEGPQTGDSSGSLSDAKALEQRIREIVCQELSKRDAGIDDSPIL